MWWAAAEEPGQELRADLEMPVLEMQIILVMVVTRPGPLNRQASRLATNKSLAWACRYLESRQWPGYQSPMLVAAVDCSTSSPSRNTSEIMAASVKADSLPQLWPWEDMLHAFPRAATQFRATASDAVHLHDASQWLDVGNKLRVVGFKPRLQMPPIEVEGKQNPPTRG